MNKYNRCKRAAAAEYWLHVTSKVPTLRGSGGTAPLVLYWFKLIRSFFFFFWLLLVPWHNNLYKSSSCIFWGTPTSLRRPCCWRKHNLFDGPIRHLPLLIYLFIYLPFKVHFIHRPFVQLTWRFLTESETLNGYPVSLDLPTYLLHLKFQSSLFGVGNQMCP